jgi:rubrerythrin
MEVKRFQRTREDFVCEHCGAGVSGNGYTNHCPQCLWSKHVDKNPGDREEQCRGLMAPVRVEKQGDGYRILHRCVVCGFERYNKNAPNDSFESMLALVRKQGEGV